MTRYEAGSFDIAVVGAGHAGVEAALAAARLGCSVLLLTLSLDAVANMPCNPSIGGTAKGHIVREIDCLGGEMGKASDATMLQSRMLNRGKGPAVHSLRHQSDRVAYHRYMKGVLEKQAGLALRQGEAVELLLEEGKIAGLATDMGAVFRTKAVIVATGTYLCGKVFVGETVRESGPDNIRPAKALSDSLRALGVPLRRFKTGTPARVDRASIDFSKMEVQPGDEPPEAFSFETDRPLRNTAVCHIAYTNEETHRIIRENIGRSPLYGGMIEGIGPRYCPSIEDKVMRFADKVRHQFFIEPMGADTQEMYLQGLSSSLPEEVQTALYRSIPGLEGMQMMRTAYAIEYDCTDPTALAPTLEFKDIPGLYGAGQFNGTSGYEEAAAQGLVAGINAARKIQGLEQIILPRSGSYIGTLIDDLVTKGCMDPYRMMTSRSEYRLLLRQDNADVRMTPLGHEIGLISEERYARFTEQQRQKEAEIARLQALSIPASAAVNAWLEGLGTAPLTQGVRAAELLRRPQVRYADLAAFDSQRPALCAHIAEQVETEIKYAGYIEKQKAQVRRMARLEAMRLPADADYTAIRGLRLEAREKLSKIRPATVGQAGRISGISPADLSVLLIWLEQGRRGRATEEG